MGAEWAEAQPCEQDFPEQQSLRISVATFPEQDKWHSPLQSWVVVHCSTGNGSDGYNGASFMSAVFLFQNGFDYMLTYSDNPQTVFPRYCVSWMVSSGELATHLRGLEPGRTFCSPTQWQHEDFSTCLAGLLIEN